VLLGGGLVVVGGGLLLMTAVSDTSDWTALLPGFIVAGIGIGIVNPNLAQAAIAVVDPRQAGMASGINSTFRQVGIATGIAGLGAIFQSHVEHQVMNALAGTPLASHASAVAHGVAAGGGREALASVPGQAHDLVLRAAHHAFVSGLDELFVIGAIVAFVGGALGFLLVRQSDFVATGAQAAGAAA
jgi:hypothetical protein